jgi:hypothetical protein
MAKKEIVTLIDDLTEVEGDDVTTIEFGIDSVNYEIDLSAQNAAALRYSLEQFIKVARKKRATTTAKNSGSGGADKAAQKEFFAKVREWAKDHPEVGQVSSRGRIAANVIDAYKKANATSNGSSGNSNSNNPTAPEAGIPVPAFSAPSTSW